MSTLSNSINHHRTGRLAFHGTENLPRCCREPDQGLYPPSEIRSEIADGRVVVTSIWPNGRANDPYCGSVEARINVPVERITEVLTGISEPEIDVVKVEASIFELPQDSDEYDMLREEVPIDLTPAMLSGFVAALGDHVRADSHDGAHPEVNVDAAMLQRMVSRQASRILDPRLEAPLMPCVALEVLENQDQIHTVAISQRRFARAR